MKDKQQEKVEQIEDLLRQLRVEFETTYRKIHKILDSMGEDTRLDGDLSDFEEEDFDEALVKHIEEIFHEDE